MHDPPASDPPPALSSCVGTPGYGEYPLSGSDGYHDECGYPTAERSERHTSQLATYTSPVQDAGQVNSTKDTGSSAQLSKGCNPAPRQGCITILLSSGECITPHLNTEIRVIKATTIHFRLIISLIMRLLVGGAGCIPSFSAFLAMCVVANATAILSCCCLV